MGNFRDDDSSRRVAAACAFLLTFGILQLEVSMTRIFSLIAWQYFTYPIISVALLGLGAAASFLSYKVRRQPDWMSPRRLSNAALLSACLLPVSLWLISQVPFDPFKIRQEGIQVAYLLAYYLLLTVPFFFMGLSLVGLISAFPKHIHLIYFADLLGGSCGSLATLVLLPLIGAPNTALASAVMAAGAGWMLPMLGSDESDRAQARKARLVVAVLGVALIGCLWREPLTYWPSPSKEMSELVTRRNTSMMDFTRWHPIARIDLLEPLTRRIPGMGGNISPRFETTECTLRPLFQDGSAGTFILQSDGDLQKLGFLEGYLQSVPYAVQKQPRVLVIGVGGGPDVLIALAMGARDVTGVEVNSVTTSLLTHRYADFAGHLFNRPDVHLQVQEGRHFLARDKGEYDVIQLSGVDTFTALSSGASCFTENYLYTVEAIDSAWNRLAPRGILSYSRYLLNPPRESLRLASILREHLERVGVSDASQHVVVVRGKTWADTCLKKDPFTREDMAAIEAWCKLNQFAVIYDPFINRNTVFDLVMRGGKAEREKFFAEYTYEVAPTSDDQPFFFNYYKWRTLLSIDESNFNYQINCIPMSLITMALGVLQVAVLGGLGILLPLLPLRQGSPIRGRINALGYFCALGLGYMFVEIPLIQKFMLFLGGPTYSLAFVLAVMLLGSGTGSLLSGRLGRPTPRTFIVLLVAIVATMAATGAILEFGLKPLLGLSTPARYAISAALMTPLALLLGVPMPLGIKTVYAHCSEWVPWAWGINSFATVLSPMLAVLLSMQMGFSNVLLVAALVYALGVVAFLPLVKTAPRT